MQGAVETCQNCNGSGMYVRLNRIAPGMVQQIQTVCRDCAGQGEKISGEQKSWKDADGIRVFFSLTQFVVEFDISSVLWQSDVRNYM